jgi:hypothetical protein
VIEAVEAGASRHEAAECFEVSVASAVKWLQRWNKERSAAPKPRGGSVSPLEAFACDILALVAEQPDLTLDETLVTRPSMANQFRLAKRGFAPFRGYLPMICPTAISGQMFMLKTGANS